MTTSGRLGRNQTPGFRKVDLDRLADDICDGALTACGRAMQSRIEVIGQSLCYALHSTSGYDSRPKLGILWIGGFQRRVLAPRSPPSASRSPTKKGQTRTPALPANNKGASYSLSPPRPESLLPLLEPDFDETSLLLPALELPELPFIPDEP